MGILNLFGRFIRKRTPDDSANAVAAKKLEQEQQGAQEFEEYHNSEENFKEPTSEPTKLVSMQPEEKASKWHDKEHEIAEKNELKELQKSFVELSDKFVAAIKEKFELDLGYKLEDLAKLENFIKSDEKFFEKELGASQKKLLPLMYAYVGEVVRRHHNGTWKKPSERQSAVEILENGDEKLFYPGTIIKKRIEKKVPLTQLIGIGAN